MRGLEEEFSILFVSIGVFTSMNSLIVKKWLGVVKGFPEFTIFVEFFPSLRFLLLSEENLKTKGFIIFIVSPSELCVGKRHFYSRSFSGSIPFPPRVLSSRHPATKSSFLLLSQGFLYSGIF